MDMTSEISDSGPAIQKSPLRAFPWWAAGHRHVTVLAIAVFAIGAATMVMYRPLSQIEHNDSAIYDYMSQSVLRGQVLYRDVIDSKAPGSLYLSALVMAVGRVFGMSDIIAIRLFYVLLAGVFCSLTFLVARTYLRNSAAAVLAASLPLTSGLFAEMAVQGTRPKIPMIIFGLLTLLLLAKDRFFWAGFCSMFACLCWQPGLAFTGVAFLIASRYLTSWRDRRALKVVAGAAIPFTVLIAYFLAVGALRDLWTWTVQFNYMVYMPVAKDSPGVNASLLWQLTNQAMGKGAVWVKLSILGFMVFAAQRLWVKVKTRSLGPQADLFRDAILIPPVVHLGFCIINSQGEEGVIPLFPFIGIFAGHFILSIVAAIVALIARFPSPGKNSYQLALTRWTPVLPLILVLVSVYRHGRSYRLEEGRTLQDQEREFRTVGEILGPNDQVYVHGTVELLVFLNRPNLNPYIYLVTGKDDYIGTRLGCGFEAILEQMKSEAPRVIALSRLHGVSHREQFLQWAREDYEKLPIAFGHDAVYVRRDSQ